MCHQLTAIKPFTWKKGDSLIVSAQHLVLKELRWYREMTESVHIWHNISYLAWLLGFGVCLGNRRLFSLFTTGTAFPSHLSSPSHAILLWAPHLTRSGGPRLPFICHSSAVRSGLGEIWDEWHGKESHLCNSTHTAHPETTADRWL